MKSDSRDFLAQLGALPPDCFEYRFSKLSTHLGLDAILDRNDLTLLCEAALRANECQAAINGVGGKINAEEEAKRVRLEWEFMTARDIFYASPGWQGQEASKQEDIEKIFLIVEVGEECLAW
jgi:hypothetical protein